MDQFTIIDGEKELLFRFNKLQVKQYRKVILFANKITDLNHFDLPVAGLFDFNQATLRKGNSYPDDTDYKKYYDTVKTDYTEEKIVNILLDIDDLCEQSDKQSDFTEVSANIAHQIMLMLQKDVNDKDETMKFITIIKNFTEEQNLSISRQWQNRYKEIKAILLSNIELFDETDKTFKNLNTIFSNDKLLELYSFRSPIIEEKIIANYILKFCSEIYQELESTLNIDFGSSEVTSTGK